MTTQADDTRERILDAFERLVTGSGERAATIAGVAEEAGLSKGGLLYHFGSKTALVEGLVERLARFGEQERERLLTIDEPVATFLRESIAGDGPIDRCMAALIRLGQLDEHQIARDAICALDETFVEVMTARLGDPDLATVVVRLSDGVYLQSLLVGASEQDAQAVERMLTTLEGLLGRAV